MTLRVVADVRMLGYPLSGVGRYTYEVMSRLTPSPGTEWTLLSHRPPQSQLRAGFSGAVEWVTGAGAHRAELWTQVTAVRELQRRGAHWFLGFSNSVPCRKQRGARRALVVYDLSFLIVPHRVDVLDLIKGYAVVLPSTLLAECLLPISGAIERELHAWLPWSRGRTVALPPGGNRLASGVKSFSERYGFLAVGAGRRKNTALLLRAYSYLSPEIRRVHPLRIVARRVPDFVGKQIIALGLRNTTEVLDSLSDGDLGRLYEDSVALVYPSAYEGLGLPAAEAVLAGLPAIVPADSPMADIVGSAGVTVSPLTAERVAQLMTRLTTDRGVWERCYQAANQARSTLSWDLVAATIRRALES